METAIEKNPREKDQNMSLCFKNGIRVIPQPFGNRFKIIIERNGKQKPGDQIYPLKSTETETGVYDKLHELYKKIAHNLRNPKPITKPAKL